MSLMDQLMEDDRNGVRYAPQEPEAPVVYQHRHLPEYTCVKVAETAKGWKVQETVELGGRAKTKTAFYTNADFHPERGLWAPKQK